MKKTLFKIFFTFLFFLAISQSVRAIDLTLTCNATSCTPKTNPALFPLTEIWYPGKSLSKTVNLTNISADPITVNISNKNILTTGDLDTVINLTITRTFTGINVFNNTIDNFYGKIIGLPILMNDTNEDYVFTATMNPKSGNEFQNKNTKFDLSFSFTVGSLPSTVSGGTVSGEYSYIQGVAPRFEVELNNKSPTPTTTVINVGQVKGLETVPKNKVFFFGLPITFILLLIALFLISKKDIHKKV